MSFFSDDPFRGSLLARSAVSRVAAVTGVIALLWVAIFWAVSLP